MAGSFGSWSQLDPAYITRALQSHENALARQDLINALNTGDTATVDTIFSGRPELRDQPIDESGNLPLHLALRNCAIAYAAEEAANLDANSSLLMANAQLAGAQTCLTPESALDVLQHLLGYGPDTSLANLAGIAPLHLAAQLGLVRCIEPLVRAGATFSQADLRGWHPLHAAAAHGHAETCQALLRYNCDVDALCRNHSSPLALAARAGHVGCMRVLIHHDATVDLKNLRRETILHFICGRPNVKRQAVKMLIEAGADVNAQSLESRTCLRAAAYAGNAEAASLLLCAGANPTIHNNSDASPLAVARQRGHGDVEQVLLAVDLFHTGLPETGVPTLEALCVARARTMHAEAGHDHRVLLANRLPLACKRLLVLNNPYLSRDLNLIAERS